jgi:pilus assembly protein CpaE
MIRQGAEDYLVKNTCNAATLARSLRYALVRHDSKKASAQVQPEGARIIALLSAKGGVGNTTIACSFASELHSQTSSTVLLADLDIQNGLVSFLTGIEPSYTLKDAIENLRRFDHSVWDRIVTHAPDGLDILASPTLGGGSELEISDVISVLTRARPFYEFVVLDLGRLTSASLALASLAQDVILVTTSGITSLYSTKRSIAALLKSGIAQENIQLVVNNRHDPHDLSRTELTTTFGLPVLAVVPFDYTELHKAAMARKLPSESSAFRREIVNIARQVAGLEPLRARRGLLPFFSREAKLQTERQRRIR